MPGHFGGNKSDFKPIPAPDRRRRHYVNRISSISALFRLNSPVLPEIGLILALPPGPGRDKPYCFIKSWAAMSSGFSAFRRNSGIDAASKSL